MAVGFSNTNKPINPRGLDASPKGYNRAALYSGKALDFDGVNDKITIDTDDIDLQEFSVVQYVNLGATAASKIFYSNYAPTGNVGFATGISDSTANVPKFYTKGTSSDTLFGSFALNAGEWYQIVATYDGATKKLYVNGVLDTEVAFSDTIVYTNATNQIGALSGGTSQVLDGSLSNVKVYSTALTAAQVSDLYNNPEKIVPTGVADSTLKLYLPMMEGAGTTAYDGSGNGNHGTISGATWTHGIGAPVSQTAVIDWNKGVNYLNEYSEDFSNAGWTKTGSSISASSESNPYGKQTYEFEVTSLPTEVQVRANISFSTPASTAFKTIVIAKAGSLDWLRVRNLFVTGGGTSGNVWFNLSTGSVGTEQSSQTGTMTDLGDGWYKCEVSGTTAAAIPNFFLDIGFTDADATNEPSATGGTGLLVLSSISLNGVYVETFGTAQTSDVLLPQGLTSGRDITGVNLFENVRKQGALNLDGNSWAEVHDNASLDITDAITLEAWVYWDAGVDKGILGRWQTSGNKRSYVLYKLNDNNASFYISSDGTAANQDFVPFNVVISEGWQHIIGVYDGSNLKSYLNGVLTNSVATSLTEIDANEGKIEIGRYQQSTGNIIDGPIAQPRIYNRALTASEVLRNYNSGKSTYQ